MALLLGKYLMSVNDQLRIEPVARRIRCSLGGDPVCDTTAAMLVWEPRRVVPMYAVPGTDIAARLTPCDSMPVPDDLPPALGPLRFAMHLVPGQSFTVHAGGREAVAAAFRPDDPDLEGRVILEWGRFDWVEEAQPVMGHPHDPFKRIDVLATDRHLVVSLDGAVLADTHRAVALHETHLPVRWYIPQDDVDMTRLEPSDSRTVCAYKGQAGYYSVAGGGPDGRDIAWTYRDPLHDALHVRDHICFYNERVDLTLDDVTLPRPRTPWSSPPDQSRS